MDILSVFESSCVFLAEKQQATIRGGSRGVLKHT